MNFLKSIVPKLSRAKQLYCYEAVGVTMLHHNKKFGRTMKYDEKTRQWSKTIKNGMSTRQVPDVAGPSPTMCRYSGKLKGGKPVGYGTLTITPQSYAYGTTYNGEWKDGRYHGKGSLITVFSSHSRQYTGDFKDGFKHGYGRESWLGGNYEGLYVYDEQCSDPHEEQT